MKRIGKALILAGVLLFLGIMISMIGIGYIIGDSSHRKDTTGTVQNTVETVKYETKTYIADTEDVQKIVLDLTEEDIQIVPAEDEHITVEYIDLADDPQYVVKSENGLLRVEHRNRGISGKMIIMPPVLTKDSFRFGRTDEQKYRYGDIVVRVPESYTGGYNLGYTSGSADVENIRVVGGLEFDLTSGDVKVSNVTCDQSLRVDMTSGDVQISALSIDGDLHIGSTSGDISLENVEIGGNLNLDATSGGCYANQLTVTGTVSTDTTSGDISMEGLTLGTAMNVSGTSGDVYVSLTDEMKEYKIKADTLSGSCNLPADYSGGAKKISVDTTSGNIDFNFAE